MCAEFETMSDMNQQRALLSPLVTVVIPTANRAKLLARAVQSVLDQSYRNVEVIVIDDASTDETEQVACGFGSAVAYIRQREKRGGSAARNVGIAEASGEFVAFLDDDDEWLPQKLAMQVAAAQQIVDGCTPVVYTGEAWIDTGGKTVRVVRPQKHGWLLRDLLYGNYIGSTSTVLASKKALDEANGFDDRLPSCQDWDLWVRLAERNPFHVLPEPLVRRSVHGERIDSNLTAQLRGREQFLQKIQPHLAQQGWSYRRQIFSHHAMLTAGRYAAGKQRQAAAAWGWRACMQNPLNPRAWYLFARIVASR
jgi:glycosyltransferase involved in cell wall biosynthesis